MFEQIKKDSIQARKSKSDSASLLTTLLSEIRMRAKDDGNREPTDEDAVKTVQKFIKSATETRDHQIQRGTDASAAEREIEVLEAYLPRTLSDSETRDAVATAISEVGATDRSAMGRVMSHLKEKHGNELDMKLASSLVKEIL